MTKHALHKIENFVKVALDEIAYLNNSLKELSEKKAQQLSAYNNSLNTSLEKAAEALYSADFIMDEEEKQAFVKKAKEDVNYLAKTLERVCKASDVAYLGKVASVKSSVPSEDPVMKRAFGYDSYSLLED
jgi:FtsZ-binding cell division protein ZapB